MAGVGLVFGLAIKEDLKRLKYETDSKNAPLLNQVAERKHTHLTCEETGGNSSDR